MNSFVNTQPASSAIDGTARSERMRLRNFYLMRAVVAGAWAAAAGTIGGSAPVAAAALLVAYPAWDAVANAIDASASGGLARNRTQAINVAVSSVTTIAVAITTGNVNAGVAIFGIWAILAGLLQLATGVRRWRTFGAQWAMVLSGAQSALAGAFFIKQSLGVAPGIGGLAGYAAFGAFYFAVSALWLSVRRTA